MHATVETAPTSPYHQEIHVMLVCSPGGHLMQMLALKPAWDDLPRTWVTLPAADTKALLRDEDPVFAHGPTNRSLKNFWLNLFLALRLVRQHKPDVILSTGAGLAVPFFIVGRLFGVRLVYLESLTRIHEPSLSGKLVYPLSDRFFVQWAEAATRPRMQFAGRVL